LTIKTATFGLTLEYKMPHSQASLSAQANNRIDRDKIPVEVKYHRRSRILELIYPKQNTVELSSEYLRVHSPSAEVQGHSPEQAVLQYAKQNVNIEDIIMQGSYAIKLSFDDKHDTGIYTWNYLWDLAENHSAYWQNYLKALAAAGKSRT